MTNSFLQSSKLKVNFIPKLIKHANIPNTISYPLFLRQTQQHIPLSKIRGRRLKQNSYQRKNERTGRVPTEMRSMEGGGNV